MISREPWLCPRYRAWLRYLFRSEAACAECGKVERPWRRMMVLPVGGCFIYVCSDRCWDAFVEPF